MDRANLISILEGGGLDLLVGGTELDWLECKREIYLLDDDKGKRELAKDVSSFANAKEGGFILIGVETEKDDKVHVDTIKKIRPFTQDIVNIQQHEDVIKEWIYPPPNVLIEWKRYKASNEGILVINIPHQSEGLRPFLISKTVEESGRRTEIIFGLAERKGVSSNPKKLVNLHQLVRDGLFYGTSVSKRFDDIIALLHQQQDQISNTQYAKTDEEISLRITGAIMNGGLAGHRKMVLVGYTYENTTTPSWPDSRSNLIRTLENPPKLRRDGWDLDTETHSKIIKGEVRRSVDEGKMILDLYRDGTLIGGVVAESGFLTWGRLPSDVKINSLALIETVYNFLSLYQIVVGDYHPKPKRISVRMKLHDLHLKQETSFMVPYEVGKMSGRQYEAPENEFDKGVSFVVETFNVGQACYSLVEEVYLWFGMDSSMIPYVNDKDGRKLIDPALFSKIPGGE